MIPQVKPITACLVAISILLYLLSLLGLQERIYQLLLITQYLNPRFVEIREGQAWRLITPIFLHFGLFHIVFNMLWIWQFGRIIEWCHGAPALIGLTLIVALVSNLSQYYSSGPWFGGMSGVIYGYFGFLWIQGLINRNYRIRLNRNIVILLLGWFVVCWSGLLDLLFGIGIANVAHTAGLLCGILIALFLNLIGIFRQTQLR